MVVISLLPGVVPTDCIVNVSIEEGHMTEADYRDAFTENEAAISAKATFPSNQGRT